jgi:hypothetical protein
VILRVSDEMDRSNAVCASTVVSSASRCIRNRKSVNKKNAKTTTANASRLSMTIAPPLKSSDEQYDRQAPVGDRVLGHTKVVVYTDTLGNHSVH